MHFKQTLTALLEAVIPGFGPFEIEPLAGDASSRRYYRLRSHDNSRLPLILMVLNPDAPKASEEGGSGLIPDELPFVNIQRFLHGLGWPVPAIYGYLPDEGLLLLEDFGDTTLEAWLVGRTEDEMFGMYSRAIDLLIRLQIEGTRQLTSDCWASTECFDEKLLRWEFDHFYEYGVAARYGALEPDEYAVVDRFFTDISRRLAALPRVLVHRDYHSRNLMIRDQQIGVIDFQDALLGSRHYDLVSLLKDSYVALPDRLIDALVEHYRHGYDAAAGAAVDSDPETFRLNFDLMSLQRNLKAAGRFDFIDLVKGNPKFLPYIPHTLENVRRTLSRHAWLAPLQEVLARKVPALRPA